MLRLSERVARTKHGFVLRIMSEDESLIAAALAAASHTRVLMVEEGVRHHAAEAFSRQFGSSRAIVVSDDYTHATAGNDVVESFRREGRLVDEPFVFGPDVYANDRCVNELQ